VRVVYSSYDAVELARSNPESQVVFFGIGFETTAPATAAAVLKAAEMGLENFSIISAHKTTSPIIAALLDSGEMRLDGLVCPGHVSVVTGTAPYVQAAAQGVPCVITGFEPVDILQAVLMLVEQVEQGRSEVEIQYSRTVRDEGNPKALRMMEQVFAPVPSNWRGIGVVPASGLEVREEYSTFNARSRFEIELPETREPAGCICGRILRGAATPADCALFAGRCTPTNPVGACMVSSEGACHAHFRFRGTHTRP
jgi:hydrogenase expression/formation protein HypD